MKRIHLLLGTLCICLLATSIICAEAQDIEVEKPCGGKVIVDGVSGCPVPVSGRTDTDASTKASDYIDYRREIAETDKEKGAAENEEKNASEKSKESAIGSRVKR